MNESSSLKFSLNESENSKELKKFTTSINFDDFLNLTFSQQMQVAKSPTILSTMKKKLEPILCDYSLIETLLEKKDQL